MLVNCPKHTKTPWASAPKCASRTHVRVFSFQRPPSMKICWQEWTFDIRRAALLVPGIPILSLTRTSLFSQL